jgi:hypothetical protein
MADNTVLNTGTGGDTIATDDLTTLNGGAVSGVKAQRVKVGYGADASFRDVEQTFPLPVFFSGATRNTVAITCYQAAGIITTEALFAANTFSRSADGATATTGVQFTVTSGKRFRIQSINVSIKNTAAAAGTSKLVLRYAAAGGTIANTSPIAALWDLGSNNAVAANYIGPYNLPFPEGMEFISLSTFGFTNLSSAATMLHTITLVGYEY